EFQHEMGTAEFHHLLGGVVAERQRALRLTRRSLIAAAYEFGVPVYTSSPGDSSIGMNVAALAIEGCKLKIDVSRDVNETAAIVLGAKRSGGKSGVLILGGGSPKNFVLQTEPQVQEVLGIEEKGHDYYIQFTDARVDTGGLSGATPSEAVSWGKVDPDRLPDTVVCYCDSTIALPLLSAYALANRPPRKPKRLSEETADSAERLRKRRVWVVDPLDGTKEFIQHIPEFCICIALVEDGRPVVAVEYNPAADRLYAAVRGQGTTVNGTPARVSRTA